MKTKLLYFTNCLFIILLGMFGKMHAQSADFNSSYIVLNINNGGNIYYDLKATTGNPDFSGANLGTFCEGNSTGIVFKGAEHNVYKCNGCDITNTAIYYSIYPSGSPTGSFVSNPIGFSSGGNNGCGGQDQQWANTAYATDLLSGLTPGNYTIEVYSDASTSCFGTVYANNNSNNYIATFTVAANVTYYVDNDNDGFGINGSSIVSCAGDPLNYAPNTFDCNDSMLLYQDLDGDGFGSNVFAPCGVANNSDCNDAVIYYVDNDNDGYGQNSYSACSEILNNFDSNDNLLTYNDADGDGFGGDILVPSGLANSDDCDDQVLMYVDFDEDGYGRNTYSACSEILNNFDSNDNLLTYNDADGDGFGGDILVPSGLTNSDDCNDNQIFFIDEDGDGYGRNTYSACGPITNNFDSNDNLLTYNDADGDGFGADTLVPNGLTNSDDCDDNQLYYIDEDGDGYGRNTYSACGPVTNNFDSNDNLLTYNDADGDGFGGDTFVPNGLTNTDDCNDNQLNYVDEDGDGFGRNTYTPCGDITNNFDSNDNLLTYNDADGDGFGGDILVPNGLTNTDDCNDNQFNYVDEDGDGFGRNTYTPCGDITNNFDSNDNLLTYNDADGDGFGGNTLVPNGLTNTDDCNDNQFNYVDEDGDGFGRNTYTPCGDITNNFDSNDNLLTYNDADGDGFGGDILVPNGLANTDDCDDLVPMFVDEDGDGFGRNTYSACSGILNNFDSNDNLLTYNDADGDGFGGDILVPNGLSNTDDCNDNDITLYHSTPLYIDMDNDGFDDGTEVLCYGATLPPNRLLTTNGPDCNDLNANVNPDAVEVLDNGLDDDCDGMTDAFPFCTNTTTWDGNSWTNGYPVADQPAVIAADYNAMTDIQACSLIVNNNAQVIVNSGIDFKITGSVTVESGASLTFENNANLIQTDNISNQGSIVSKRNTSMRRLDYTYWSSPVADQNLLDFSPLTSIAPTSRFYELNETTNAFVSIDAANTSFSLGKGYSIRAPNTFPTTVTPFEGRFEGTPNNGTIQIPITATNFGFNLIGNPYPSPINANLFLNTNPGTLYFWTHRTQGAAPGANYASYNILGGTASVLGGNVPNGTIQTGQGFMLLTATNGDATFTNTMRVGNNQGQFYRTNDSTEKHRFWLNLSAPDAEYNQILVGYMTDATSGIDASIDGKLLYNGSAISSLIDQENYVIQGRGLPFATSDEVPLGFKAETSGTFVLGLDHFDGLFENQSIYLKDNLTGIVHDLKESAYTFASASGTFNERFAIVYQNSPLGTDNADLNPESIVVYKENGSIKINTNKTIMQNVRLFDMRGRMIYEEENIGASSVTIENLKAEQQILIVQITDENNRTVSKKLLF